MPDLIDLQATPHAPDCHTRRVGSTDWPHCSCGLRVAIEAAGSCARRDGPSVRPNWPKPKKGRRSA